MWERSAAAAADAERFALEARFARKAWLAARAAAALGVVDPGRGLLTSAWNSVSMGMMNLTGLEADLLRRNILAHDVGCTSSEAEVFQKSSASNVKVIVQVSQAKLH